MKRKAFVSAFFLALLLLLCACTEKENTPTDTFSADAGASAAISSEPASNTENPTEAAPVTDDANTAYSSLDMLYVYTSTEEMAKAERVTLIVSGKITATETVYENHSVETLATLEIRDVLKGEAPGKTVSFLEVGGHLTSEQAKDYFAGKNPDDDFPKGFTFVRGGYTVSAVGDEVIVFLGESEPGDTREHPALQNGYLYVAAAVQGKFTLLNGNYKSSVVGEYSFPDSYTYEDFTARIKEAIA